MSVFGARATSDGGGVSTCGVAGREKNDMVDLRLDGPCPADGSYRL